MVHKSLPSAFVMCLFFSNVTCRVIVDFRPFVYPLGFIHVCRESSTRALWNKWSTILSYRLSHWSVFISRQTTASLLVYQRDWWVNFLHVGKPFVVNASIAENRFVCSNSQKRRYRYFSTQKHMISSFYIARTGIFVIHVAAVDSLSSLKRPQ